MPNGLQSGSEGISVHLQVFHLQRLCRLWSWFVLVSVLNCLSLWSCLDTLFQRSASTAAVWVWSVCLDLLEEVRDSYIPLPVFTVLAWGKEELSPRRRLPAGDKRFRGVLPVFVSAALYLGITPGSWSITPLQSGSPQWVACSPFRAVTQERQCNTPVGSTESFRCFIVSSAHWDEGVSCCSPLHTLSYINHQSIDTPSVTEVLHACQIFTAVFQMSLLLLRRCF